MKEPVWVDADVVQVVHEMLIAEHGGRPGLRDATLLDSALARPRQRFHYEPSDLFTLAALCVTAILQNHPFADGNKRAAFMTGYIFLARNGKTLSAPENVAAQMVWDLAAGTLTEETFALWLRDHCR